MSKLNKLMWFARRFNTLIPLGVTVVVFGLIVYGIVSVIASPTKLQTTVASTPDMEKIEEDGTIFDLVRETGFRGNSAKADDLFILKLVAKKKSGRGYENEFRYGTRNLLHVNERTGQGRWLFPTQQQVIRSQEIQIDEKGQVLGLVLTVQPLVNDDEGTKWQELPMTVYFVSANLKEKVVAFEKIDEFFAGKKLGDDWSVVYKKGMQVHHALYSFKSKKVLTDNVVASLEAVK
jgi:hypothetical protein